MVFHWSLRDSKSPLVSRILLCILADFNNAVVWMVSTRPLISKFYCSCNNPLVTVPSANYNWYHRQLHVHSFFNSLARSRYLSLFSSLVLPCDEPECQSSLFGRFSFFFFFSFFSFLLTDTKSSCLAKIRWSVFISKSQSICVSLSSGRLLTCAHTICSYGQI